MAGFHNINITQRWGVGQKRKDGVWCMYVRKINRGKDKYGITSQHYNTDHHIKQTQETQETTTIKAITMKTMT